MAKAGRDSFCWTSLASPAPSPPPAVDSVEIQGLSKRKETLGGVRGIKEGRIRIKRGNQVVCLRGSPGYGNHKENHSDGATDYNT